MSQKIGFIGLGRMGNPMAQNLVKAGFDVTVYDVVAAAMEPFAQQGIKTAASIAQLTRASDVIISIVPADKHIMSVYTDPQGVFDSMNGEKLIIEMTSAMGSTVKKLQQIAQERALAARFVDAPVSGGVAGAQSGTLTIMLGGEEAELSQARPILEAMGKNLLYAGKLGDGKTVKMLNQLLNAMNTTAMCEVLYLAKKLEVNPELLLGIVNKSSGASWVSQTNAGKFIAPEQYEGGFKLGLMTKDVHLTLSEAQVQGVSLPGAAHTAQVFDDTMEKYSPELNYNVVYEWIKAQNA